MSSTMFLTVSLILWGLMILAAYSMGFLKPLTLSAHIPSLDELRRSLIPRRLRSKPEAANTTAYTMVPFVDGSLFDGYEDAGSRDQLNESGSISLPRLPEKVEEHYRQVLSQSRSTYWFSLALVTMGYLVLSFAGYLFMQAGISAASLQIAVGLIMILLAKRLHAQGTNSLKGITTMFEQLRVERQRQEAHRMVEKIEAPVARDALRIHMAMNYARISGAHQVVGALIEASRPSAIPEGGEDPEPPKPQKPPRRPNPTPSAKKRQKAPAHRPLDWGTNGSVSRNAAPLEVVDAQPLQIAVGS
ncbi:MAG: hypothetical protein NT069_36165 [Planctomycetota bacterium]|nr:hypothetical protein [Planctomycetota bacterium]